MLNEKVSRRVRLKEAFPVGSRVELVYTSTPYAHLKPGDRGTVRYIDEGAHVCVSWDSGGSSSMVPGKDVIKIVKE